MNSIKSKLKEISSTYKNKFKSQKIVSTYADFLDLVAKKPYNLTRNSATYIRDCFNYFEDKQRSTLTKGFKLFEFESRSARIIGGKEVQDNIYNTLDDFACQGFTDKLILLHGPNGSSKTSTLESIQHAMEDYSYTDDGAVYTFSWIFPTEKYIDSPIKTSTKNIGFIRNTDNSNLSSYAFLDEDQIASKVQSEFRDNPIFLLPVEFRKKWLQEWFKDKDIPSHLLQSGLSKKNLQILEALLTAYDGDLSQVFKHIQVERFNYSKQYRVGISTVEPKMHQDAFEKMLTMDKNISNLPSILHNIRFHEASGALVEGNRGIVEFSDLLKRPLEAFKYLLTTLEKATLNLPSSNHKLDIVFFATTNEKHLDAFKNTPDFSSFRARFKLLKVPYLLDPNLESQIYQNDCKLLSKNKVIIKHSVELLALWACLTRLKKPHPNNYEKKYQNLVSRIGPYNKLRIYTNKDIIGTYSQDDKRLLKELRTQLITENNGSNIYEGRLGASPREIKGVIHAAAQKADIVTPLHIFSELTKLIKDISVYDFLQIKPQDHYHDSEFFIKIIKDEFIKIFELEIQKSMNLVHETAYQDFLDKYIKHVVANIKKEDVRDENSPQGTKPSEQLMTEVERILEVKVTARKHREELINKIAAAKIETPNSDIKNSAIYAKLQAKLESHYYNKNSLIVEQNCKIMITIDTNNNHTPEETEIAENTFRELQNKYGYDKKSAIECLQFLLKYKK